MSGKILTSVIFPAYDLFRFVEVVPVDCDANGGPGFTLSVGGCGCVGVSSFWWLTIMTLQSLLSIVMDTWWGRSSVDVELVLVIDVFARAP